MTVLVATRRELRLSQERLAKILEWHRSRLAKIESGERRIDVPEFINIANGMNIDPTQLLSRVLRWHACGVICDQEAPPGEPGNLQQARHAPPAR